MKQYEQLVRALALQNAIKFKGVCNPKALIGGVLKSHPEAKSHMNELMQLIDHIANEVNQLNVDAQSVALKELESLLVQKESSKKEGLRDLPGAEHGKVVMRFAPSPSGPLHIGHSYPFLLNYLYAKKYDGKFILRIEDTNPDNIDLDAYTYIPEDANWLTHNGVSEVLIQSDRLEIYYKYAAELFDKGHLYVCTCDPEEFRGLIVQSQACPCRGLSIDEQKSRWMKMFTEYKQGDCVVRVKTDINHKNPAMRDFPVFRINENEHPRVGRKYKVWPLMNFSVFVDDVELGMTHVIRGKDHTDNAKRQEYLYQFLNKTPPHALFGGKINFEGFEVSCSKTRKKIQEGIFSGWDDVQIPFIRVLKRRGYQPETFQEYVTEVGLTKNDKTVSMDEFYKHLNFLNKQHVDKIANRLFFVADPILITIDGAPTLEVELDLHPDSHKGGRKFVTKHSFFISQLDLEHISEGDVFRLIDLISVKRQEDSFLYHSRTYDEFKAAEGTLLIHWLNESDDLVDVNVLMPDGSTVVGLCEPRISEFEKGVILQFERFGFVRIDSFENNVIICCFLHQ